MQLGYIISLRIHTFRIYAFMYGCDTKKYNFRGSNCFFPSIIFSMQWLKSRTSCFSFKSGYIVSMLLLIHPHGDNVNIDETIISHVRHTKKKIVMLLTPISNYSIYAHMSVSTLHANSHLNILIRRNKFIFLYIKQNECGQDGGNVENFLLWL